MTVGFHAPLPPARTGVADYAAALLAALRRHGEVRPGAAAADVHLYHLGNNQLHREIYRRALDRPGVVVLHDAVLHHFFLGALDEAGYVSEFVYNYGEWRRGLACELWRGRAGSASKARYFRYPMLRRIAEASRATVVHNAAAAELVRRHAPAAPICEIPHLFEPPATPAPAEALRWRQRLGIPPQAFLFSIFGFLRESKRLLPVLGAFERLRREQPRAWLLVAGAFASSDLERAAAPLLAAPAIVRLPYLPEREFWSAAAATDACINLRYPAAGESSGIAVRLMGLGKPVLLSVGPEYAAFPQTACLRVETGPAEGDSLLAHLLLLTSVPGVARDIGSQAAAHILRHHAVDRAAARYWKVLCESRSWS